MTWYLEDKSIWASALAMSLAMVHVNKSLSLKAKLLSNRNVFFFSPPHTGNFSGGECSFGDHSYASAATRGKSYVSSKLGRILMPDLSSSE